MAVVQYKNLPVLIAIPGFTDPFFSPETNVTISFQANLEASRLLAPNQNGNLRIGGGETTKISLSFLACTKKQGTINFNLASGIFHNLTGSSGSSGIIFGANQFQNCFLEELSFAISPYTPMMVEASFYCVNAPVNNLFLSTVNNNLNVQLTGHFAYGYNTVINDLTPFAQNDKESITYKISCSRSYSTTLGATSNTIAFLDGVEQEMNIKSHAPTFFIDYTGGTALVTVDPKNDLGTSVLSGGLVMSSNSRIINQGFSVPEGGFMDLDISIKEVLF